MLVTLQFLEFLKRRLRVTQQFKSKLRVIQQLFVVLKKKVVSDSAIFLLSFEKEVWEGLSKLFSLVNLIFL